MNNVLITALSAISQGALYPVIIILILILLATLVLVVSTVVSYFTERRPFKASMNELVRDLEESDCQGIPGVIARSSLLKSQKIALMNIFNVRDLPQEARWNVAKRSVFECGKRNRLWESVAEVLAKIAPMAGLMGTLIPLGPGLEALGTGEIGDLASALVVAFDTTVIGLIAALFCLLVARCRASWNDDYANTLDSAAGTLFDKLSDLEEEGDLTYEPPAYALVDEEAEEKEADKEAKKAEKAAKKAEKKSAKKSKADKEDDDAPEASEED